MIILTSLSKDYQPISRIGSRWIIRFDPIYDGEAVTYMQHTIRGELTEARVRSVIDGYYNEACKEKILSGMHYADSTVWLTAENQANYAAAATLAQLTDGGNLPYRIKLGDDAMPIYHDFIDVGEIVSFWRSCQEHISQCVQEAWERKADVDYSLYSEEKVL